MTIENVLAKIDIQNDGSGFAGQIEDLLYAMYATTAGKALLDEIVASPDTFKIEFTSGTAYEDPWTDPISGETIQTISIDPTEFSTRVFLNTDGTAVKGEQITAGGRSVNSLAVMVLAHELKHGLVPTDTDPQNIADYLDPVKSIGDQVAIEQAIAEDLMVEVKASYTALTGGASHDVSLTLNKDYTPGFAGAVDVTFIDNLDQFAKAGNPFGLNSFSPTNSHLIILGSSDNEIYGSDSIDFIHTNGGADTVFGSTGSDYLDGGGGNDILDYHSPGYTPLNFTFALHTPASGAADAVFTATPDSGGWVDRFTDFETVKLSTQDTTLTINGANTLEALNAEAIKTCEVPPIAYSHRVSSCFGFASTAQKWLKKALLPLVFLGAAQPALADWDGFGENRTWIIEGQVMSVTRDGFILLRPYGGEEDEIIKLHQWGLKVNAGDLTMITLARRLTCAVLYDAAEYLGVDCYLSFFEDAYDNPILRGLPHNNTARGSLLWFIMYTDYGGSAECSQDDTIYGKEIEDQTGLFIACGQSSEAGETE